MASDTIDNKFEQLTKNHRNQIEKGALLMKEGIEQSAYELGGKVKEEVNKGQAYAKNALHALEEETKSHPLMTIGISVLLGMVALKIMSSK